uniref:Uncharacterized protein n=1 Tax=Panagrolaimus davidi TaxID=227884 RepID=A0A914QD59_9BILA
MSSIQKSIKKENVARIEDEVLMTEIFVEEISDVKNVEEVINDHEKVFDKSIFESWKNEMENKMESYKEEMDSRTEKLKDKVKKLRTAKKEQATTIQNLEEEVEKMKDMKVKMEKMETTIQNLEEKVKSMKRKQLENETKKTFKTEDGYKMLLKNYERYVKENRNDYYSIVGSEYQNWLKANNLYIMRSSKFCARFYRKDELDKFTPMVLKMQKKSKFLKDIDCFRKKEAKRSNSEEDGPPAKKSK